jgi:hypothetical protein
MRYTKYLFITFIIILSVSKTGFAIGKIVDYFLSNQNAWNNTKRITDSTPAKVVVKDGLEGLRLELTDLTDGDEVALIFLETKKVEKMRRKGFCNLNDKLIRGNNRIVSVITRNYGNRKKFHYKFILKKSASRTPVINITMAMQYLKVITMEVRQLKTIQIYQGLTFLKLRFVS